MAGLTDAQAAAYNALGRLDYEFHGKAHIVPVFGDGQEHYFKGLEAARLAGKRWQGKNLRNAVTLDKRSGRAYNPPVNADIDLHLKPRGGRRKTFVDAW